MQLLHSSPTNEAQLFSDTLEVDFQPLLLGGLREATNQTAENRHLPNTVVFTDISKFDEGAPLGLVNYTATLTSTTVMKNSKK